MSETADFTLISIYLLVYPNDGQLLHIIWEYIAFNTFFNVRQSTKMPWECLY